MPSAAATRRIPELRLRPTIIRRSELAGGEGQARRSPRRRHSSCICRAFRDAIVGDASCRFRKSAMPPRAISRALRRAIGEASLGQRGCTNGRALAVERMRELIARENEPSGNSWTPSSRSIHCRLARRSQHASTLAASRPNPTATIRDVNCTPSIRCRDPWPELEPTQEQAPSRPSRLDFVSFLVLLFISPDRRRSAPCLLSRRPSESGPRARASTSR
jgi:hypothetical protein